MVSSGTAAADPELQVEALWDDAFAAYQRQTNRDLRTDPVIRRLRTVNDVLEQIEESKQTFGTWRSRHSKVWERLSSCMRPIEVVAELSKSASEGGGPFGAGPAAILGAALYLVKVGRFSLFSVNMG